MNPTTKKLTDAEREKVDYDFMNAPIVRTFEKMKIVGFNRWVRFPIPETTVQIRRIKNPAYDVMPYIRFDDIPKEYRTKIAESANGSRCPAPPREGKIFLYQGDVERWLRAIVVRVQFIE